MMELQVNTSYPNINMQATGKRLKMLARKQGYSVSDIQKYLHLSCPQPIYRWYQGKVLPTVDHLYMLSMLFEVHMEELIVPFGWPLQHGIEMRSFEKFYIGNRLFMYYNLLYAYVA